LFLISFGTILVFRKLSPSLLFMDSVCDVCC
jgi:hypothetical protein